MSSVWVCSAYGGVVPKGTPQQCDRLREKKCYRHGTIENDCDAVEYAPVKRGRWIDCDEKPVGHYLQCSVCGQKTNKLVPYLLPLYAPYCGMCGAKMSEEEK